MKLAILGPSKSKLGYSTERLLEEAQKSFKKVDLVPVIDVKLRIGKEMDAVWGKKSLKDYDYVLTRIDASRAQIGYPVVRILDQLGVNKPYKAESIIIAHNKFITLEKLVEAGIRVPETFLTGSRKSAKSIIDKHKLPIVLKLLSGFGGLGVMFMETREAATSAIETMKTLKQEICVEEFIKNPGEDVRGIVAGDEVIASFKRIAAKGERRANVKIGGRAVPYNLPDETKEIAIKAAKAIGADICAVDMIEGDRTYVIEVNINPGLKGIEGATNLNVAQRIVEHARKRAEEAKK